MRSLLIINDDANIITYLTEKYFEISTVNSINNIDETDNNTIYLIKNNLLTEEEMDKMVAIKN